MLTRIVVIGTKSTECVARAGARAKAPTPAAKAAASKRHFLVVRRLRAGV
jgi:hypothetical protein